MYETHGIERLTPSELFCIPPGGRLHLTAVGFIPTATPTDFPKRLSQPLLHLQPPIHLRGQQEAQHQRDNA